MSFAAGTYAFTVTADDGVRLFVDGMLVIDRWVDQGATTLHRQPRPRRRASTPS